MSKEDTQICTTCGTINPQSGGTCLKCGNLFEEDDNILYAEPTTSTDQTISPPSPSFNDRKSDGSLKTTIQLPLNESFSPTVNNPNSSVSNPEVSEPSSLPASGPQPQLSHRNPLDSVFGMGKKGHTLIITLVGTLLVIIILFLSVSQFLRPVHSNPQPTSTSTSLPYPIYPQAIGVYPDEDGENIGLSDGSYALDVRNERPGSDHKIQASEALRKNDGGGAIALWNQAYNEDSNDAETLIYLEDQRVLASGKPYVTIVVGTLLADKPVDYTSRDELQGAYIGQEMHNKDAHPGDLLLRLLVAKSGNVPTNSIKVANQIVQAAQSDKTIVGVLGWSTTNTSLDVVQIFAKAHLPLLSASAAGDYLTGISLYFFRVISPNKFTAAAIAKYTETKLQLQKLVVIYEKDDPFSQSYVDSFTKQYVADGHQAPPRLTYERLSTLEKMTSIVQSVLPAEPDGVLLVGTRSTDIGNLRKVISDSLPHVKVLASGGIYSSTNITSGVYPYTPGLSFDSSGFPDEWQIIKPFAQVPSFFSEYKSQFDPYNQHAGAPYGYQRPTEYPMQAYDAMITLLQGIQIASGAAKQAITGDDLQQALLKIKGSQSVQGVTGQISFGDDHDPANKENLILQAGEKGLQLVYYQGCFLVGDTDCGPHFA